MTNIKYKNNRNNILPQTQKIYKYSDKYPLPYHSLSILSSWRGYWKGRLEGFILFMHVWWCVLTLIHHRSNPLWPTKYQVSLTWCYIHWQAAFTVLCLGWIVHHLPSPGRVPRELALPQTKKFYINVSLLTNIPPYHSMAASYQSQLDTHSYLQSI